MMARDRLESLRTAVEGASRVLILPHNDPDPDAIASAMALRYLLTQGLGLACQIVYQGIIGRAENKALVRYLGRPLRRLTEADLSQPVPIALVDTQPGAGNNALPPGRAPAIVIDHHTWSDATASAIFADVRTDIGATSTMLAGYLQAAGLEPSPALATALFYGIKTDTMGLGRGASPADAAAYFYLQPLIDAEALVEIERAQVPARYFKKLVATLQAARVYDGVVISYMGAMRNPDMAAEMADLLLRLQGIRWAICMGVCKGDLILSVRTRSGPGGAGQLVRSVVGNRGTAGGHGVMAGGQVPVQGEDPQQVALLLGQAALRHLEVAPEVAGEPLI